VVHINSMENIPHEQKMLSAMVRVLPRELKDLSDIGRAGATPALLRLVFAQKIY